MATVRAGTRKSLRVRLSAALLAVVGVAAVVGLFLAKFAIPITWNLIGFAIIIIAGLIFWAMLAAFDRSSPTSEESQSSRTSNDA